MNRDPHNELSGDGFRRIVPVPTSAPWAACILPVSGFPVTEKERELLRGAVVDWVLGMAAKERLTLATWIQMSPLHKSGGARMLSQHAKSWLPETGLGVWPDRDPPRLWRDDDFLEREWGAPLPTLMHTVFHVSGPAPAPREALSLLIGSGTAVSVLLAASDPGVYHEQMQELLLPSIEEEALRGHPFYLPLLEAKSLQHAGLDDWMGAARVYFRESVEDSGVLVICPDREMLLDLDQACVSWAGGSTGAV